MQIDYTLLYKTYYRTFAALPSFVLSAFIMLHKKPHFISFIAFIYLFILRVCMCGVQKTTSELVLSFRHVGPKDCTQVVWVVGRYPYLLSHLFNLVAAAAAVPLLI